MYQTFRKQFYWLGLALNCYQAVLACSTCARERIKLQSNSTTMKLFPPSRPLEDVSMDLLAFAYGISKTVLTDNEKKFNAKFLQQVYRILGVKPQFTTTYHLKSNGQTERFNRTIISSLKRFIADHPKD
eukprot:IDg21568t1